jgi:hypothetical protein
MILQLNPPIPLFVPGKGPGMAVLVTDYGPDWDHWWTIILDRSGEVWTVPNSKVRGVNNVTMDRPGETMSKANIALTICQTCGKLTGVGQPCVECTTGVVLGVAHGKPVCPECKRLLDSRLHSDGMAYCFACQKRVIPETAA